MALNHLLGVMAHAAIAVINDLNDIGTIGQNFHDLVDLLLVLSKHQADICAFDGVNDLGGHGVFVQGHGDGTQHLGCAKGHVKTGPIVTEQGNMTSPFDTNGFHGTGQQGRLF